MRRFIICCSVVGTLVVLLSTVSGEAAPGIGDVPPPLELSRVLHGPSLADVRWDKFHGRVVVLEFWDTRCVPCVAAIPHWNDLVQQFSQKPVVFLSLSDDNPNRLTDFLKRRPIKGWIAIDAPVTATLNAFEVLGIPHTVIVDAAGKIAAITHPTKLEGRHIEEVLAGKPCSLPAPAAREPAEEEVVSVSQLAAENQRLVEISIRGPFPKPNSAYNSIGWEKPGCDFRARKAYLKDALAEFFDVSLRLVVEETPLPQELYDIIVAGPEGKSTALRAQFLLALKAAFGITARTNIRPAEIFTLTVATTTAAGLKKVQKRGGGGEQPGGFSIGGGTMDTIAWFLESALDRPVRNETADTDLWACSLKWEMSPGELLLPRLYKQFDDKTSERLDTISFDELPPAPLSALSPEDLSTLKAELAKAKGRRFQPDPMKVIAAAREQLGLELKSVKQVVTVLEIRPSDFLEIHPSD